MDSRIDATDHLCDFLERDVRKGFLTEINKDHIGGIAQIQEFKVVLPCEYTEIDKFVISFKQFISC